MKVIIACAGSGGHVNPGIAIANVIVKNEPNSEILFIGTEKGLENDLVKKAGYNINHIRAGRFIRKITFRNLRNFKNAIMGILDAKEIIGKFNPDVIIGTGGYICVPVMRAAVSMNIPYILHESNAFPGLSVKLSAKKALKIFVGFEQAKINLGNEDKIIVTGSPAKFDMNDMLELDKAKCKEELGLVKSVGNKRIIFVTGGSQGAKKFNDIVIKMVMKYKPKDFYMVIATGMKNYEQVVSKVKNKKLDNYLRIEKFIYDMDKMYKASDLLISRAGAMTITELAIARRPAILIPLPTAAENHQLYNAEVMEEIGAGIVLEEKLLNEDLLHDKICSIISNDNKLLEMGNNASKLYKPNVDQEIYDKIVEAIRG